VKRTPRITKAERNKRVTLVTELLLNGLTRREIIQYIRKRKEWAVGDRMIDRYIAAANKWIEEQANVKRTHEFGLAIARLNNLYKRSMAISDYKTALAIQREITSLLGLERNQDTSRSALVEFIERQKAAADAEDN